MASLQLLLLLLLARATRGVHLPLQQPIVDYAVDDYLPIPADPVDGPPIVESPVDEIVPIPGFTTPQKVAMAEKAALLAFAKAFGNHPVFFKWGGWANASLGMTYENTKPCVQFWKWITCDIEGRVNAIAVPNPQMVSKDPAYARGRSPGPLKGQIPWAAMRALGNLVLIDLQGNNVYGPVLPPTPWVVKKFSKLQEIMMQDNRLTGVIPNQISLLKSLQKLDVSLNRITGPIPRGIASLHNLTWLATSYNRMVDVLPPAFGALTQMRKLDIGNNKLRGAMPASWGYLKKLQLLNLQNSNLQGRIPNAWAGMISLNNLRNNRLWGPLPPASQLFAPKRLTSLDVSSNFLTGAVPKVPAGRVIQFTYSNNCFKSAASPKARAGCPAT